MTGLSTVIPVPQLSHQFEWDQEVDWSPVLDTGSMLNYIPGGSALDVVCETRSEVEIKSSKVHLLEVLPIVHVKEDVDVSGPTETVEMSSIFSDMYWREERVDELGEGESDDPVNIEDSNEQEEVVEHCHRKKSHNLKLDLMKYHNHKLYISFILI